MNKLLTSLFIVAFGFGIQSVVAQSTFATIIKNVNVRAKGVKHSLNATKDTLLLESNKKINLEVNYDQLPNIWTELKSKENFEKISNGKIKFRLDIDKNSNKIINFSYIEEKK